MRLFGQGLRLLKLSYNGITEPGSPGAPLFNINQKIIGVHRGQHCGRYYCENPDDHRGVAIKFGKLWNSTKSPYGMLSTYLVVP